MSITGTIEYIELGMGFWGIVTAAGDRYRPLELPVAYQQPGKSIRATVEPLPDIATAELWGTVCRITALAE